jgi:hypothetical protein
MWLLLIVVTTAVSLYSIPKIVSNIKTTGLTEALADYRHRSAASSPEAKREVVVFYINRDQPGGSLAAYPAVLTVSQPANVSGSGTGTGTGTGTGMGMGTTAGLNQLMEMLIAGPGLELLSHGYITLIPRETKLIGSRIVGSAAYMNFSRDLIQKYENNPELQNLAVQQIILTALEYQSIKDAVILIDGDYFTSSRDFPSP